MGKRAGRLRIVGNELYEPKLSHERFWVRPFRNASGKGRTLRLLRRLLPALRLLYTLRLRHVLPGQRRCALRYQGRLYPVFPRRTLLECLQRLWTMPRAALTRYFGYRDFRAGQQFIVESVLQGRDALGVMPTGAGKSMCYQIPGIVMPGLAPGCFSARVAYGRPGARSY